MFILLIILIILIIVGVIWLIKNVVEEEPQDEWYSDIQKERIKPKNNSIKTEYIKTWNDLSEYYENLEKKEQEKPKKESVKSWDDLSREYSENLRKIEEERQKKEQSYFNTIVEKEQIKSKNNVNSVEQVKSKNNIIQKEIDKTFDDLPREYSENLRKIEEKRVKNGFYEIPKSKHANNSLDKTKTAYELLLECPEWKNFRKNIIEIKGKQCEWCATNKNLQVHHKYYLKTPDGKYILPWRYNINALLVLCKNCHEKAHKKYKIKSYYTNY